MLYTANTVQTGNITTELHFSGRWLSGSAWPFA